MANGKQSALVRARARRVKLDRDRAARDARVEQAAAKVFVLQDERATAEQAVAQTNLQMGQALRELLTEGLSLEALAELCELTGPEVRRLLRTATPAPGPQATAPVAGADAGAGAGAGAGAENITKLRPAADAPSDVAAG